ncbi:MarR family transcriptional regulator [Sinorhizobium numidicum]|uniref:MarR family transcriptional regulator n=1 Tax=Sinorhizobium numidicum TaxID=680248 RepID=A0ABY8D2K6_9HYPH|nr:MarR family transcriptional regulator [Sinorhizobium numidicum]WEX76720.1 MarR family transcriptional regulator [Sinorhizobium numidicum]WEX83381.1 MarR family transcriptional regulator [Sinorhizobium numidicum]
MAKADVPASDDLMKLDNFLCFAIYSANHAFTRVYKPLLDELELTYPQYLVMVVLWEKDDQTVGSLGEKLFLESSTLTPMLKRLEAMGYVSRVRDKADERQVRVRLTDTGRALRAKAKAVPLGIAGATEMEPAEISRLKQEIAALRASLLK